jgi:hypothetical protein
MYEILIKVGDNTSPDPEKDRACYKNGDVVQIEKEGYCWTPEEKKRVVRVDISNAEAKKYVEVKFDGDRKTNPLTSNIIYRRIYFVQRMPSPSSIITIDKNDIVRKD